MLIVFLFGLILSVSPMTAIRGEAAVGPLDIAMVAVAILTFLVCFRPSALLPTAKYPMSPTRNLFEEPVAKFWIYSIPVLIVSTLIQISSGAMFLTSLGRDTLSFAAAILTTIAASSAFVSRYRTGLIYGFCAGAAVVATSYAIMSVGDGIGYNTDGRFVGGSLNPNQTALHAISFIIVCYCIIRNIQKKFIFSRMILGLTIIASLKFGLSSQSDAFKLAIIPVATTIIFLEISRLLESRKSALVLGLFVVLFAIMMVELFYSGLIADSINTIISALTYGDQDIDRISLWVNGIDAWKQNILFGNGIGAWSGVSGPFSGMEAHNAFVDWLSISGVVGLIIYISLIFTIFRWNINRNFEMYIFLVGIMIFSMFGFYFRSPIYWLCFLALFYRQSNINDAYVVRKLEY